MKHGQSFKTMAITINGTTGITTTGDYDAEDGDKILLGTGDDLQIYHDGSDSFIDDSGTGNLFIRSSHVQINKYTGENMIKAVADGAVELYHNNVKKLETYANGCTVTGNLNASNVDLGDNAQARFGTDNDANVKHSGSDFLISNGTGTFDIKCTSGTGAGEGSIVFSSGTGTEAMRINAEGDLQIGQTANDTRLGIKQRSSAVEFITCRNTSDSLKFYIHASGNAYNTNNSWNQISDQSLKENIVDAKSQWNAIKNIKIRNFNFTEASGYDTHTQIGCVAQEVELVSPKLVTTPRDDGIKTVSTSVLYMKAVKALQEAIARIETLETKVAALEAA